MGDTSYIFCLFQYPTSFICFFSLITLLLGSHDLKSRYEEENKNSSLFSAVSRDTWGKRTSWSEFKLPSSTHMENYYPSSLVEDVQLNPLSSSKNGVSLSSVPSGRRSSVEQGSRSRARKFPGNYQILPSKDLSRFHLRRFVTHRDDASSISKKNRDVHGKRAPSSKDSSFLDKTRSGSNDSRRPKSGSRPRQKVSQEINIGRGRNRHSYHASLDSLSSFSSMPRGSINSKHKSRGASGIFSLPKLFGKGGNMEYRRSHRRQVLDKSFFLPSLHDLSESESLRQDNNKRDSIGEEFDVPSIQQVPEVSPLKKKRPNIILVLTDDLDVELGSLNYMPNLLRLMGDGGALFPNAYTTTPMCCPSRSSMLTGMYIHNHQVFTNHQNCSSRLWQRTHEKRSFASYLSKAGYKTGYYGKYLNRYNGSHVPSGWKEWAGLVMNSRYYNYTINRNNHLVKYGNRYPYDYYPHVITNDAVRFLQDSKGQDNPFLMVISYPSPHGPEDSAPEHAHKFFNASDHHTASYNYAPNPDKQWILQFTDRMAAIQLKYTDLLMTKRLQTLQTIDRAIEKIVNTVDEIGETDNTYLFFTSDHGYHLGQFGLAKGKSMPFEFDVKVPFLVRGPGVKPGVDLPQIALNVDLAPTFLDIAGLPRPPQMDGRSLLPILQSSTAPDDAERLQWRDSFLIESSGRVREEEEFEKKEQRTWERERALTKTILEATSSLGHDGNSSIRSSIGSSKKISLYTSKHERLEDVCQRIEFALPCQRTQKWHCTKIGSRWKLKKCRKNSSFIWQKHCICRFTEGIGSYRKLDVKERRKQRNFLKKHVGKDFQAFDAKFVKYFHNIDVPLQFASPSLVQESSWNEDERHRQNRHRRSTREPSQNVSGGHPFIFHSENFTTNPIETVALDESEVLDQNVTENDTKTFENSSQQPPSSHRPPGLLLEFPILDKDSGLEERILDSSSLEGVRGPTYPPLTLGTTRTDDLVHHFVEEEELRDIKDQIHELTDEIYSLETVGSTTEPLSTLNASLPEGDSKHGCHATDGHIDCQDEVYENFSAWRNSKVEIEDQIRRLRQQLNVMKNIWQHLQVRKPSLYGLYEAESYDELEDFQTSKLYDVNLNEDYPYGNVNGTINVQKEVQLEDNEDEYVEVKEAGKNSHEESFKPHEEESSDITFDKTIPRQSRKNGSKKQNYYWKERKRYGDVNLAKLYYPVSFPTSETENPGDDPSFTRFCWCDRRALKKLAVKEAREKKRQERRKIKEKRNRRQKRKRKKPKSDSCNYAALNCYTHDNDHWKTPPLWTDGHFCFCLNSANNTYWCLRTINETHNFLYCEFITGLITYYDLHIDPYQLRNVAFTLSNEKVLELNEKLTSLRSCKGADECDGWKKRDKKLKTEPQLGSAVIQGIPNLKADLPDSPSSEYLDALNVRSSWRRKKIKKLRDRQRKKKLRKEKKYKNWLKFDGYSNRWPNDPFSGTTNLEQSIRLPRKSRHRKGGRKQRRRDKKRQKRKRRKQRRLSRNRFKNQISPSIAAHF